MNDRDRYHTASPDNERRALRDLLNLLPPCPECRHRRCLPWARRWTRYFAELVQPGTDAPGMPLALLSDCRTPARLEAPALTMDDTLYTY